MTVIALRDIPNHKIKAGDRLATIGGFGDYVFVRTPTGGIASVRRDWTEPEGDATDGRPNE